MGIRIEYEWVVEWLNEDGDILDCSYWPDTPAGLDDALKLRAQPLDTYAGVDFGLCRHEVEHFADGGEPEELGRSYAYCDPSGVLARTTDSGATIPARFTRDPLWKEA